MDLEELRLLNQDLLQKLRANQEEFKKRTRLRLAIPSSPGSQKATRGKREVKETKEEKKENRGPFPKDGAKDARRTVSSEERGLRTEKPSPDAPPSNPAPKASVRMPRTPKSILLTPQCGRSQEKAEKKKKKESGRVTFMSEPTEDAAVPEDRWSVRPFLGYDWIAGLLDVGSSSVAEKPDQYFSELQEFRRVNRDACVYDRDSWSESPAPSALDRESERDPVSHQCVFCYRLNKRLFPEPLDPESACPVCKNPRNRRPPETPVEPAFVRVSIPRSTLLPAYKHKIHRRKSYEAADDLALPSHCLAGWENPLRAFSPTLSSLDLGSSLDAKPPGFSKKNSRISGGTRTDELLDLSRVAEFELGNVARLRKRQKPPKSVKAN